MKESDNIAKGVLSYAVAPAVTGLITILVVPVVSYSFPSDEYGKINMFYTLGSLFSSIFLLGFDHAAIRYYFEPPKRITKQTIFTVSLVVGVVIDLVVVVLVLLSAGNIISFLFFGENNLCTLIFLGLYIVGLILFRLVNISARMQGFVWQYNIQLILQNIISRLSFVIVLAWTTSYFDAIVVMSLGMFVLGVVLASARRKAFSFFDGGFSFSTIKVLFCFGFPCMLNSVVTLLDTAIGRVVLGNFGQFGEIGVLAIATTLASAFSLLPSAFNTFWSPYMYKNYKSRVQEIRDIHDYVMLFALLLTMLIMIFQDILYWLVGGEYRSSQVFFMLLMLSPIKSFICETTGYGVMLKNKPFYATVITVIGVAVNCLLVYLLAPKIGACAAGIGVACSSVFVGMVRSLIGCRLYKSVNSYKRSLIGACLIIILCIGNTFIYQEIVMRVLFCALAGIVAIALYRVQIRQMVDKINNLVVRTKC